MSLIRNGVVFSYFLLATGYACANGQFDSGGIALGMSPEEARAAAKSGFRFQDDGFVTFKGSNKIGAYYAHRKGKPMGDSLDYGPDIEKVIVNFSTHSQKAVSIVREQYFPKGAKPNVEVLAASLTKKYGPASFVSRGPDSMYFFWQRDTAGSVERWQSNAQSRKCASETRVRTVATYQFVIPETFKSDCGISIYAHFDTEEMIGSPTVQKLQITLVDHQTAYADLKKDAEAKEAERVQSDRKRLKESEAVKVNL